MSEARAVTNFSGNAVATVLIGAWTRSMDRERMANVLDGKDPFDEQTMVDDNPAPAEIQQTSPAGAPERVPVGV
ncbi:MAG: C4-dicarboxylate transporter DctA [Mycobacterium sp.]|nr:C4-dicarboxylate transporter DctA [Mycobacterium sp.]